jgi:hypothetical protein
MKNKKKEPLLCEDYQSKKKKAPTCATCGSKEVSVIGFCYECGDTSITPGEND